MASACHADVRPCTHAEAALLLQISSALHYQLPPTRFWRWWCGGFTPVDLVIYTFVWALMVTWTWQLTQGYWSYLYGEPALHACRSAAAMPGHWLTQHAWLML